MKSIIIASTSTLHGGNYLDYLLDTLKGHFKSTNEIIFIPYARPGGISYEDYTNIAKTAFNNINKKIVGIHEFTNPTEALKASKGIFVGGGNTFVLVNALYKNNVISVIKDVVLNGTPYFGTSAGSNICGLTMNTTNDMPIVQPPNFKTLGLVPFNINPHYLDPNPNSKHMGEIRETRIKEFHAFNTQPVIGLREGSWIEVKGDTLILKGNLSARVFLKNKPPFELQPESNLNDLK